MDKDSKLIILFSSIVFLIIGGWSISRFLSPFIEDVKNKNLCVDVFTSKSSKDFDALSEGTKKGYLRVATKEKWSRAQAYRICSHRENQ